MDFRGFSYKAFGEQGEFERPARVIHELPTPQLRRSAISAAKTVLGFNVQFGVPLGVSNGLTRTQIKNDHTGLMATRGGDLPLSLLV